MANDVKISDHAKEQYKIRCSGKYHFRKLVSICNNMRKGLRSIARVNHYRNTYSARCCYFDYKENLVFVFSDTMKRLLTVRNDLDHFNIVNGEKKIKSKHLFLD